MSAKGETQKGSIHFRYRISDFGIGAHKFVLSK